METATASLAAIESINKKSARVSVHVPHAAATRADAKVSHLLSTAHRHQILGDAVLEEAEIHDEAWASSWKRYYRPFLLAANLYIVPSWQRAFRPSKRAQVLRLDPGMAFGTGQHATTKLAATLLLRSLKPGDSVIDVGCGSGILALTAALRGAHVCANDADPIAIAATNENFTRNKLKVSSIRRERGVPSSFPQARIITANITARVLASLAPKLAAKLKTRGILITSGVVESGRLCVLDAFRRSGLQLSEERRDGEWYAFVHRKVRR